MMEESRIREYLEDAKRYSIRHPEHDATKTTIGALKFILGDN
jgi:hypothetical protein